MEEASVEQAGFLDKTAMLNFTRVFRASRLVVVGAHVKSVSRYLPMRIQTRIQHIVPQLVGRYGVGEAPCVADNGNLGA